MPGIFDHIFARYGRKVNEFYNLTLLDPAYRVEVNMNRWRASSACLCEICSCRHNGVPPSSVCTGRSPIGIC